MFVLFSGGKNRRWFVSAFSYANKSYVIQAINGSPEDISFGDRGAKLYIVDSTDDLVYEYDLSTPWDVSTVAYNSVTYDFSTQLGNASSIAMKPDGTKIFIMRDNGNVFQYTLSTPWDVNSAIYDSKTFAATEGAHNKDVIIRMKSDGTKAYILSTGDDIIYQYVLSSAWDISTASYDSVFVDVSATGQPVGFTIGDDGKKLYVNGDQAPVSVYQYTLTSAWDLGTAISDVSKPLNPPVNNPPVAVFFNDDGGDFYILNSPGTEAVFQFSI